VSARTSSKSGIGESRSEGRVPRRRGFAQGRLRDHDVWFVLALTLLGAALRFGTLEVQSIWGDESTTLILVRHHFGWMISHFTEDQSYPPLYFVALWVWTRVVGLGIFGFRSFSAVAGTLTIPVMYLVGRHVSPRAGRWAAVLTTVSAPMYYYSQEARAYALLILLAAVTVICWQRALEAPTGRRLALWAVASSLALLTHYFAVFLLIPEVLILAMRLGWRRAAPAVAAVGVVGLALVPLALSELSHGDVRWIEGTSLPSRLAETVKQFLIGLYGPVEILSAVLAGLLAASTVALLLRWGGERERGAARDMAVLAVVGIALPLLLAAVHAVDVFDGRNVILIWVPVAAFLALGLASSRTHRAGISIGVGLCLISLAVIASTDAIPGYQRDDWRGIGHALRFSRPGGIIVGEANASFPLSIYLPAITVVSAPGLTTSEVDFVALRIRSTGGSPLPAPVNTRAPAGFRLVGVKRTETYAVARFVASRPTEVSALALSRLYAPASPQPVGESQIIRRD
jgi:hypothetical protein